MEKVMHGWPPNVGIISLEVYFPREYVDQSELEVYDGVSAGKYTIGLGQSQMGFCSDLEDIHSLCLTVVHNLMSKSKLSYNDIGRLEVGTETIVDKSKSVKTVLMQLFADSGNYSVEGVDTTNACYGGTSALFNAFNWVESSSWDGRYALVVTGDIAVYSTGSARCTGGAGAIAMLVGANAPLIVERGIRGTHIEHTYDFYKPNLSSEYPVVDGKLSIQCYLRALDSCYRLYRQKFGTHNKLGSEFCVDQAQAFIFHSPYCKLVQKSFARLVLNDFLNQTSSHQQYSQLSAYSDIKLEDTYFNKEVETAFMKVSIVKFMDKTQPSLLLANRVGNMYTPSLYGGLASFIASASTPTDLINKRVVLFSYGSGLASSMFSLRVTDDASPTSSLTALYASLSDLHARLNNRIKVTPTKFAETLKLREDTHHLAPYTPKSDPHRLFPSTFYMSHIDDKYRRSYLLTPSHNTDVVNGKTDEK